MLDVNKKTKIFGYEFRDCGLLKTALTHPSTNKKNNYQRLEFLGDRILDLVVAEYVFKKFPNEKEGDLAKRHIALVCGEMISMIAKENVVGEEIIMSIGEHNTGGRQNKSNLEDVVESIFAAIYIDSGDINVVREIILQLWKPHLKRFTSPPQDPKSELQEIVQKYNAPLPIYELVKQEGPAHEPVFTMKIIVKGQEEIQITSNNKKKGEIELAKLMLSNIDKAKLS